MKWACKNTLGVYNYTIDIENLLSPIYHLILDLLRNREQNQQFDKWIGEIFNVALLTEQGPITNYDTEDSFLVVISRYLEDFLYEKVDLLENSDILMLYRTKHLFIAPVKKNNQILINWIKRSELMDKSLELINNAGISDIKTALSKFMNEQYFGNYVQVNESELKGTFIPKHYVGDYKEIPIDETSIWLCDKWKIELGVQKKFQCKELVLPNFDGECIAIDDWVLSTEYIDHIVKQEFSTAYFWTMLNNVYAKRNVRRSIYREQCSDFALALKNAEFAKLMNDLQYNLYLQSIPPCKFKHFFEEVYNIEQFKEETNQVVFTGIHAPEQMEKRQTMFGLYNTIKNDTEFNLRAWINIEPTNKQKITTSKGVSKVDIKTVYALKPFYSYYFCKDYFEDMFSDLLEECTIQYLNNFELYTSDTPCRSFIEIDNMIRKTDKTLVYIENKTTLSRYNIEETLNKVANFHQKMTNNYSNVQMEYILVALYQNKSVEEGFSYFVNAEGNTKSNFKIPVASYNGVKLHCIVEPEYAKLKTIMEQLLK